MIRQVVQTSWGIGDACGPGLMALGGLKAKYPEDEIWYVVRQSAFSWASLFTGYDRLLTRRLDIPWTIYPYDLFSTEIRTSVDRLWIYCQYTDYVQPVWPALREIEETPYGGHVVLAPFSYWQRRSWAFWKWLQLESRLRQAGINTVVIDHERGRCLDFKGAKVLNQSPRTVASVIAGAACLVGNDSGMTHIAGVLRTPIVAICGPTNGQLIFGSYKPVSIVQGLEANVETVSEIVLATVRKQEYSYVEIDR